MIYEINGFTPNAPHWDIAYIEAASKEEALIILKGILENNPPDTYWEESEEPEIHVREVIEPLCFVLGGGCR